MNFVFSCSSSAGRRCRVQIPEPKSCKPCVAYGYVICSILSIRSVYHCHTQSCYPACEASKTFAPLPINESFLKIRVTFLRRLKAGNNFFNCIFTQRCHCQCQCALITATSHDWVKGIFICHAHLSHTLTHTHADTRTAVCLSVFIHDLVESCVSWLKYC